MRKIAVLVSKEPHCLMQLIADARQGTINAQIACVLSNHPDLQPVAESAGVQFAHHVAADDDPQPHFDWLASMLEKHSVDLVVLARYKRILPPTSVAKYRNRIINIHPSLAPSYPGPSPYRQAFDSGVQIAGCTAHFVTEQLDEGPVIWQDVFRIRVGHDSLEDVKRKGIDLEAKVLSRAVQLVVDGAAELKGNKVFLRDSAARSEQVRE